MGQSLPFINATLNFCAAVCLVVALIAVKKKHLELHKKCIFVALLFSAAFLSCYIYFHFFVPQVPYSGEGILRPIYFSILLSHTTLAIVVVPFIVANLVWGLKGDFKRHKKFAPLTWLIWFYVSCTGVITYLMKIPYYQ